MIVADTNLIVALTIPSPQTAVAERVWNADPLWYAPPIATSEFTYVLWKALAGGKADYQSIAEVCAHFTEAIHMTIAPAPWDVLERALKQRCSTYD